MSDNSVSVKVIVAPPPPPEPRVILEMSASQARAVRTVLGNNNSTTGPVTVEVYLALSKVALGGP